jgi:acetylornithine deacetylase/succinyl-diaminopimelate desuccinylase-like protein
MEMLDLTKKLVGFRSVNYRELEFQRYISSLLSEKEIEHHLDVYDPSEYTESSNDFEQTANLYVSVGTGQRTLFLYSHIDVVEGKDSLFNPEVIEGRLYGRGTSDMKTSAAGMLYLLLNNYDSILEEAESFDTQIIFGFIADEETTATGIKRFVDQYQERDLDLSCVLFEPTDNFSKIEVGGRGYTFFDLEGKMGDVLATLIRIKTDKDNLLARYPDLEDGFGPATLEITKISAEQQIVGLTKIIGSACHASRPDQGINPFEEALLRNPSYVVTESTEGPNSLSSAAYALFNNSEHLDVRCKAHLDLRTNLAASENDALLNLVKGYIGPHINVTLRDYGEAFLVEDHGLVELCKRSAGFNVEEVIAQAGSDAPYLLEISKNIIPGFGPGYYSECHKDSEHVTLDALEKTPEIMMRIINNFNRGNEKWMK